MSTEVTVALKKAYQDNVTLLTQQMTSHFGDRVRVEPIMAEFEYFDRIGATKAQKKGGRHSDTPLISTPHDRRRVTSESYNWADLVSSQDKIRGLGDVSSAYAQNAAAALMRAKDSVIIDAFFAPAYTGKEGEIPIAFPSTQQIAVDYVSSGSPVTSGLTISKLRRARTLLRKANVNLDEEEAYIAVTATQVEDLLTTTEVTSGDYNNVKALVEGSITRFMGFNFVDSELLTFDASGYQRIPVWCKSGMLLAVGQSITTKVSERPDKNYEVQVYAEMDLGATRMEEVKVLEIKCEV